MSDDSARPEVRPGTRIGLYEVVAPLGSGGYADVFKVERDGNFYALKLARGRADNSLISEGARVERRLLREQACLQLAAVPGVVRIYETGRWPDVKTGWVFCVLDLVEGLPVDQWRATSNPSPRQIALTFAGLAHTLQRLHAQNIFHRDLKSSNVLVSARGEATVIDLSIALVPWVSRLTEEGTLPGTRSHFCPELVARLAPDADEEVARFPFDAPAELHSVGYMLYQVLAGRPPFDVGRSLDVLYEQIERKVPARPRDLNPHVPEALDAVAMKLLAKQPARRPQTALELARELEDLVVRADASWDAPLEVPAWAPEEGEETRQDDTTPALRSRWSARLRKAWRARGAWLLGASLAGLVLLGALVAGQRLAQDTLPDPQPQPLDQAAPAEPQGAPPVPPTAPAEPPAPVPITTASAPLGKKGQPMKSDTRSRESRRRPPATVPASAAGRFVVPPAITALCAAAVTACVTPGPLPAVPSREALQCPRQPSHRLGIKAATPGQRFMFFGNARNLPGGPTADCANRYTRPCWIQVGPTPKMNVGGYREDKSSPWIIPPPDYGTGDHLAFGETRVIGDRLYAVVTRLELYDGRVVPLCALAYPSRTGDPNRPYFEVLKRDGKRVLVNSWMNEFRLHPLEDF